MRNRKDPPKETMFSPFEVILIDPNLLFGPHSQTIDTFPTRRIGPDPSELTYFKFEMVEVVVLSLARSFEEQDLYDGDVYDPSRVVYLLKVAYDFNSFWTKSKVKIQAEILPPYEESGVTILHLEEGVYYRALEEKNLMKMDKLMGIEEALTYDNLFVREYAKKISTSP